MRAPPVLPVATPAQGLRTGKENAGWLTISQQTGTTTGTLGITYPTSDKAADLCSWACARDYCASAVLARETEGAQTSLMVFENEYHWRCDCHGGHFLTITWDRRDSHACMGTDRERREALERMQREGQAAGPYEATGGPPPRVARLDLISAGELHKRDMADPAYRRSYRLHWLPNRISILWLRFRHRGKREA